MTNQLSGVRVAILVDDAFEQVEMTKPREALDGAGAKTVLISPQHGSVQGWNHEDRADKFAVDVTLAEANPSDYDALLLPGGVQNPDKLRMNDEAVHFVKSFQEQHKPIAAICHGPWMLVETGIARGRTLTSWPSLKTDVRNAGGVWVDKEVVVDQDVVTSRKPDDIPAFNREMINLFANARQPANAK